MKSNWEVVDGNENFKEDLEFNIKLMRWILKSIGVWPNNENTPFISKFLSRLIIVMFCGLLIFLIVPNILYLTLEVKDTYLKIKFFGPLSFFFMVAIKYYCLLIREDLIKQCIHHVEVDWRSVRIIEDRQTMLNSATFGKRLMKICAVCAYGAAAFFYFVMPISIGKVPSEDGNYTYRPLPFAFAKLIVDHSRSPYNEIIFSIQCFSGYFLFSTTTSACNLAAFFVLHACGQLEVMISLLGRLVEGTSSDFDTIDDRIACIIEHHVRTINFIACTERLLREISLVEVAGCTLNMCLLGYYVIKEWSDKQPFSSVTYVTLLTCFTFNIFIFCYIGELFTKQCERVGQMTYMIDWYKMPEKKSLSLILTMVISNKTKQLTAGNFFTLSLACFGDVMKTSVAYLNMLRKVT